MIDVGDLIDYKTNTLDIDVIIRGMMRRNILLAISVFVIGMVIFEGFIYYQQRPETVFRSKLADSSILSNAKITYTSGSYWPSGDPIGLVIGNVSSEQQLHALLASRPFKDCVDPENCTDWVSGQDFSAQLLGDGSYTLFQQLQHSENKVSASKFLSSEGRCMTRYSAITRGEPKQKAANRDEFCVLPDGSFAYIFREF